MEAKLFNTNKVDYGDDYNDHLFEQYKLYIQGIENISERRLQANNFFISINTALISVLGLSFNLNFLNYFSFRLFASLVGFAICVIFWHLIRAYKQLNTGKFVVLHEIESKLPLCLYKYEWKVLEEGKNKKVYFPFSHIELYIPWLLGIVYLVLSLIFLFSN